MCWCEPTAKNKHHHHGHRWRKMPSRAPHEAFRSVPLRRIDRGRPPKQTDTLFTGVERVYDPKRLRHNVRGGEEWDCGAKSEVARLQPAGATRETVARQDSWWSDNQPAQVRSHKRGGGTTREVAVQRERCCDWRGKRGEGATTNRWRERGAMRQALARR
jgi:hypothetical protein